MCDFSHLHCHTQYSLLDGAARIKRLVSRAAELELPGLGITDHGNLFGVPEFYTAARKAGVKPVIGSEFYLTPSGMGERQDRTRYHQVLWAKNEEGYHNLIKLSSLSYTDGYYYKPRIDRAALERYGSGLVASTCCLQGEVLQTILHKGEDAARAIFEAYLEIFGDDYFIEIQDHGIADQKKCNAVLLRWAKEYNVKVVATNDVHYVDRQDAEAQDVLLCLQTGKDYHDPSRMRFENDQFYLKTADEMTRALKDVEPAVVQQALTNSTEIVERCQFDLAMGTLLMPHYPIPEAFQDNMDAYLRHLVYERARPRYGDPLPQHVVERLDYELGIIRDMGFAGYFLIVQDFTTAARDLGVSVGPGRGSAAGSAVAYCLGITNIDPLQYDLLFERFLNPERVSMPDIDIDFDDRGRARVIDYVVQKYGRENVCQIITFGTMGARSVIRDVARVLSIPLAEADRIAKLIPEGPKVNLASAIHDVPEFADLRNHPDAQIRNLMHYAEVLEGSARHTGVHAAGVIIAPGDVSEYVPIAVAKSKGDQVVTTQFDGSWVEDFGLLKMDFLGLKTLTVLNDALALIKANHSVDIDLDAIPLDDEATYRLFQRGETVSIFQFESSGMREWMLKLKPTSINDLIAMNALYRPGPMDLIPNYIDRKHGREDVDYPHPMLASILETTYGIPVYQEQVMQMAQVMGGFTLGKADILRRGMGKKKKSVVDAMYPEFLAGATAQDVDEQTVQTVWEMMAKFSGYGFNKCVVGETEITHAESGQRTTVGALFHSREPFTIHALDDTGRLVPRRVTDVMWNGRKPVFELRTRLGKRIVATGNHPFRTLGGWTNLEDLRPGTRIAAPRRLRIDTPCPGPTPDLFALACHIQGAPEDMSIPEAVFTLCDADIERFLEHLGVLSEDAPAPFVAATERLARDLQSLLLRLGIVATVEAEQNSTQWSVRHDARSMYSPSKPPCHTELDSGSRGVGVGILNQVQDDKGRSRQDDKALGPVTQLVDSGNLQPEGGHEPATEGDIVWDEVVEIVPRGVQDTYDLTVERDHNFVADGLIVHNSHSAAYSLVAYQTAYLKANYPPEFMAAAMTNEMGTTDKLAVVLEEARKMGLSILPPAINASDAPFTVEDGQIRFGLGGIKGVGLGAIEALVQTRAAHGPFKTLFQLTKHLDLRTVGKKALESLAAVGALDELEGHRAQQVEGVDLAFQYGQKSQADAAAGQSSLFAAVPNAAANLEPSLPHVEPWSKGQALKMERDLIGFYVSGHPLDAYQPEVQAFSTAHLGDTETLEAAVAEAAESSSGDGYGRPQRPTHSFCGILTDVQRRTTKSGRPIAFATLEDFSGQAEVTCFASVLDRVQPYLQVDEVVLVRGEVEVRGGDVRLVARDVIPMWKVREQLVKGITLTLDHAATTEAFVDQLHTLCTAHRGACRLYFEVRTPDVTGGMVRLRSRQVVVDPTPDLMKGLAELVGTENVRLEGEVG
ncbi:MAG: DNA polymerase III subunit alpha [Bacteroidota bacterium]